MAPPAVGPAQAPQFSHSAPYSFDPNSTPLPRPAPQGDPKALAPPLIGHAPQSPSLRPVRARPSNLTSVPLAPPFFLPLRPRAFGRRFQEATPTTSSRAPRPRPRCPLRSLAPPLEAPLGLRAQGRAVGETARSAGQGPTAGRLPGASARSSCLGASPIRCWRGKRPRQKPD